jgi:hypothetical protein
MASTATRSTQDKPLKVVGETVADVLSEMDKRSVANMRVWNAVCRTDPKHTKRVNQRGGFTAIDAQYQIMEATRLFGPVGEGWGYIVGEFQIAGPLIIVPVTLWHGTRENTFGPILGCAEIGGQRPDRDAPKKAITDAITKGLSQLGFNADVFLGLFDDNKYVAEVTAEFAGHPANDGSASTGEPKKRAPVKLDGPYTCPTQLMTAAREFVRTLNSIGDLGEFVAWKQTKDVKEFVNQLRRDMPDWWSGGPSVPADFVPLEILVSQKKRDLEQIEEINARSNA